MGAELLFHKQEEKEYTLFEKRGNDVINELLTDFIANEFVYKIIGLVYLKRTDCLRDFLNLWNKPCYVPISRYMMLSNILKVIQRHFCIFS